MKTLSLLQPWASFVMLGLKKVETRSWCPSYRGPLLIHASAGKSKEGRRLYQVLRNFAPNHPDVATMPLRFEDLPFGKILCEVELCSVWSTSLLSPGLRYPELLLGDYAPGRFGWVLRMRRRLAHLPAKGRLGLWEFPIEEEKE